MSLEGAGDYGRRRQKKRASFFPFRSTSLPSRSPGFSFALPSRPSPSSRRGGHPGGARGQTGDEDGAKNNAAGKIIVFLRRCQAEQHLPLSLSLRAAPSSPPPPSLFSSLENGGRIAGRDLPLRVQHPRGALELIPLGCPTVVAGSKRGRAKQREARQKERETKHRRLSRRQQQQQSKKGTENTAEKEEKTSTHPAGLLDPPWPSSLVRFMLAVSLAPREGEGC